MAFMKMCNQSLKLCPFNTKTKYLMNEMEAENAKYSELGQRKTSR